MAIFRPLLMMCACVLNEHRDTFAFKHLVMSFVHDNHQFYNLNKLVNVEIRNEKLISLFSRMRPVQHKWHCSEIYVFALTKFQSYFAVHALEKLNAE